MPSALAQSQMAQLNLYASVSLILRLICLSWTSFLAGQDANAVPHLPVLPVAPFLGLFLRPHLSMLIQADSLFSLCGHALKALLICNAAHQTDSVACGKWHVA